MDSLPPSVATGKSQHAWRTEMVDPADPSAPPLPPDPMPPPTQKPILTVPKKRPRSTSNSSSCSTPPPLNTTPPPTSPQLPLLPLPSIPPLLPLPDGTDSGQSNESETTIMSSPTATNGNGDQFDPMTASATPGNNNPQMFPFHPFVMNGPINGMLLPPPHMMGAFHPSLLGPFPFGPYLPPPPHQLGMRGGVAKRWRGGSFNPKYRGGYRNNYQNKYYNPGPPYRNYMRWATPPYYQDASMMITTTTTTTTASLGAMAEVLGAAQNTQEKPEQQQQQQKQQQEKSAPKTVDTNHEHSQHGQKLSSPISCPRNQAQLERSQRLDPRLRSAAKQRQNATTSGKVSSSSQNPVTLLTLKSDPPSHENGANRNKSSVLVAKEASASVASKDRSSHPYRLSKITMSNNQIVVHRRPPQTPPGSPPGDKTPTPPPSSSTAIPKEKSHLPSRNVEKIKGCGIKSSVSSYIKTTTTTTSSSSSSPVEHFWKRRMDFSPTREAQPPKKQARFSGRSGRGNDNNGEEKIDWKAKIQKMIAIATSRKQEADKGKAGTKRISSPPPPSPVPSTTSSSSSSSPPSPLIHRHQHHHHYKKYPKRDLVSQTSKKPPSLESRPLTKEKAAHHNHHHHYSHHHREPQMSKLNTKLLKTVTSAVKTKSLVEMPAFLSPKVCLEQLEIVKLPSVLGGSYSSKRETTTATNTPAGAEIMATTISRRPCPASKLLALSKAESHCVNATLHQSLQSDHKLAKKEICPKMIATSNRRKSTSENDDGLGKCVLKSKSTPPPPPSSSSPIQSKASKEKLKMIISKHPQSHKESSSSHATSVQKQSLELLKHGNELKKTMKENLEAIRIGSKQITPEEISSTLASVNNWAKLKNVIYPSPSPSSTQFKSCSSDTATPKKTYHIKLLSLLSDSSSSTLLNPQSHIISEYPNMRSILDKSLCKKKHDSLPSSLQQHKQPEKQTVKTKMVATSEKSPKLPDIKAQSNGNESKKVKSVVNSLSSNNKSDGNKRKISHHAAMPPSKRTNNDNNTGTESSERINSDSKIATVKSANTAKISNSNNVKVRIVRNTPKTSQSTTFDQHYQKDHPEKQNIEKKKKEEKNTSALTKQHDVLPEGVVAATDVRLSSSDLFDILLGGQKIEEKETSVIEEFICEDNEVVLSNATQSDTAEKEERCETKEKENEETSKKNEKRKNEAKSPKKNEIMKENVKTKVEGKEKKEEEKQKVDEKKKEKEKRKLEQGKEEKEKSMEKEKEKEMAKEEKEIAKEEKEIAKEEKEIAKEEKEIAKEEKEIAKEEKEIAREEKEIAKEEKEKSMDKEKDEEIAQKEKEANDWNMEVSALNETPSQKPQPKDNATSDILEQKIIEETKENVDENEEEMILCIVLNSPEASPSECLTIMCNNDEDNASSNKETNITEKDAESENPQVDIIAESTTTINTTLHETRTVSEEEVLPKLTAADNQDSGINIAEKDVESAKPQVDTPGESTTTNNIPDETTTASDKDILPKQLTTEDNPDSHINIVEKDAESANGVDIITKSTSTTINTTPHKTRTDSEKEVLPKQLTTADNQDSDINIADKDAESADPQVDIIVESTTTNNTTPHETRTASEEEVLPKQLTTADNQDSDITSASNETLKDLAPLDVPSEESSLLPVAFTSEPVYLSPPAFSLENKSLSSYEKNLPAICTPELKIGDSKLPQVTSLQPLLLPSMPQVQPEAELKQDPPDLSTSSLHIPDGSLTVSEDSPLTSTAEVTVPKTPMVESTSQMECPISPKIVRQYSDISNDSADALANDDDPFEKKSTVLDVEKDSLNSNPIASLLLLKEISVCSSENCILSKSRSASTSSHKTVDLDPDTDVSGSTEPKSSLNEVLLTDNKNQSEEPQCDTSNTDELQCNRNETEELSCNKYINEELQGSENQNEELQGSEDQNEELKCNGNDTEELKLDRNEAVKGKHDKPENEDPKCDTAKIETAKYDNTETDKPECDTSKNEALESDMTKNVTPKCDKTVTNDQKYDEIACEELECDTTDTERTECDQSMTESVTEQLPFDTADTEGIECDKSVTDSATERLPFGTTDTERIECDQSVTEAIEYDEPVTEKLPFDTTDTEELDCDKTETEEPSCDATETEKSKCDTMETEEAVCDTMEADEPNCDIMEAEVPNCDTSETEKANHDTSETRGPKCDKTEETEEAKHNAEVPKCDTNETAEAKCIEPETDKEATCVRTETVELGCNFLNSTLDLSNPPSQTDAEKQFGNSNVEDVSRITESIEHVTSINQMETEEETPIHANTITPKASVEADQLVKAISPVEITSNIEQTEDTTSENSGLQDKTAETMPTSDATSATEKQTEYSSQQPNPSDVMLQEMCSSNLQISNDPANLAINSSIRKHLECHENANKSTPPLVMQHEGSGLSDNNNEYIHQGYENKPEVATDDDDDDEVEEDIQIVKEMISRSTETDEPSSDLLLSNPINLNLKSLDLLLKHSVDPMTSYQLLAKDRMTIVSAPASNPTSYYNPNSMTIIRSRRPSPPSPQQSRDPERTEHEMATQTPCSLPINSFTIFSHEKAADPNSRDHNVIGASNAISSTTQDNHARNLAPVNLNANSQLNALLSKSMSAAPQPMPCAPSLSYMTKTDATQSASLPLNSNRKRSTSSYPGQIQQISSSYQQHYQKTVSPATSPNPPNPESKQAAGNHINPNIGNDLPTQHVAQPPATLMQIQQHPPTAATTNPTLGRANITTRSNIQLPVSQQCKVQETTTTTTTITTAATSTTEMPPPCPPPKLGAVQKSVSSAPLHHPPVTSAVVGSTPIVPMPHHPRPPVANFAYTQPLLLALKQQQEQQQQKQQQQTSATVTIIPITTGIQSSQPLPTSAPITTTITTSMADAAKAPENGPKSYPQRPTPRYPLLRPKIHHHHLAQIAANLQRLKASSMISRAATNPLHPSPIHPHSIQLAAAHTTPYGSSQTGQQPPSNQHHYQHLPQTNPPGASSTQDNMITPSVVITPAVSTSPSSLCAANTIPIITCTTIPDTPQQPSAAKNADPTRSPSLSPGQEPSVLPSSITEAFQIPRPPGGAFLAPTRLTKTATPLENARNTSPNPKRTATGPSEIETDKGTDLSNRVEASEYASGGSGDRLQNLLEKGYIGFLESEMATKFQETILASTEKLINYLPQNLTENEKIILKKNYQTELASLTKQYFFRSMKYITTSKSRPDPNSLAVNHHDSRIPSTLNPPMSAPNETPSCGRSPLHYRQQDVPELQQRRDDSPPFIRIPINPLINQSLSPPTHMNNSSNLSQRTNSQQTNSTLSAAIENNTLHDTNSEKSVSHQHLNLPASMANSPYVQNLLARGSNLGFRPTASSYRKAMQYTSALEYDLAARHVLNNLSASNRGSITSGTVSKEAMVSSSASQFQPSGFNTVTTTVSTRTNSNYLSPHWIPPPPPLSNATGGGQESRKLTPPPVQNNHHHHHHYQQQQHNLSPTSPNSSNDNPHPTPPRKNSANGTSSGYYRATLQSTGDPYPPLSHVTLDNAVSIIHPKPIRPIVDVVGMNAGEAGQREEGTSPQQQQQHPHAYQSQVDASMHPQHNHPPPLSRSLYQPTYLPHKGLQTSQQQQQPQQPSHSHRMSASPNANLDLLSQQYNYHRTELAGPSSSTTAALLNDLHHHPMSPFLSHVRNQNLMVPETRYSRYPPQTHLPQQQQQMYYQPLPLQRRTGVIEEQLQHHHHHPASSMPTSSSDRDYNAAAAAANNNNNNSTIAAGGGAAVHHGYFGSISNDLTAMYRHQQALREWSQKQRQHQQAMECAPAPPQ